MKKKKKWLRKGDYWCQRGLLVVSGVVGSGITSGESDSHHGYDGVENEGKKKKSNVLKIIQD